jgi:hypothetical protein
MRGFFYIMTAPRSNAAIDQNRQPTLIGVSTADGFTPVAVEVDPLTGQVQVSSSGGGGGAVTIADGASVTLGSKADAKSTATDTTAITIMSVLKQISASVQAPPSPTSPTTILNGKTTVTTAGTRVVLASSTACSQVIIRALETNTGLIYVGSSSVASTNGHRLLPGESVGLSISNLNTVNLDSAVSGEGVSYLAS